MSAVTGGMCVCVCDRSVNTGGNLLCNETNILCITVQWSLTTLIIASSSCRQITCLCVFTARAGASCVYLRLMRRKKYESLNISVGKSRSCNSKNNNRMVTITCTNMLLRHLKTSVTHRWLVSVLKDVLISQWGMSFVKFKVLIGPHCFIFGSLIASVTPHNWSCSLRNRIYFRQCFHYFSSESLCSNTARSMQSVTGRRNK